MARALAQTPRDLGHPQEPGGAFVSERMLGAGPDGMAVLARAASGEQVELRSLTHARRGSARWSELEAALRTHAMLEHPSLRTVSDVSAGDPPVAVLDWPGDLTLSKRLEQGPLVGRHAMQLAEQLAHAVGAAHRVGLVHGMLVPSLIHLDAQGRPRIEMTGVCTWEIASFDKLDKACLAPEHWREPPDTRTDVYAIGGIMLGMMLGRAPTPDEIAAPASAVRGPVGDLIATMLVADRDLRPSAAEVVLSLRELGRASSLIPATRYKISVRDTVTPEELAVALGQPVRAIESVGVGDTLGRFEIVGRLGEGGMGEVFEGIDLSDGRSVAVKVLRRELANDATLMRRFRREARTLAQVRNPFVANVLDVNFDRGVHYIALEFVAGATVADVQEQTQRFSEREALEIAADACRALAGPHRLGIVHRDIKPENMMFVSRDRTRVPAGPMVKLCDFGIARSAEGAERKDTVQVTQEGMLLGTPMFMAPEQCVGTAVSPATDVYSLGVTLYMLISGHPPFDAEDPMGLLMKHMREPAPALASVASDCSDATAQLVARALAKDPKERFPDAGEMLDAIEKILRGEPTEIEAHPHLPADAAAPKVREIRFEVELEASPEELWPYVCNSDRLNRAVGMPVPTFETQGLSGGREDVRTTATNRVGGTSLKWREAPFEWVEGRRWGAYRVFDSGPFHWFVSDTELERRPEGGTRLHWRMRYVPRNWLMAIAIAIEMRFKQLPVMKRVFARVDALLTGKLARSPENDVFEKAPAKLARAADERVQAVAGELVRAGLDAQAVEHVTSYLRFGSEAEMARIRPLEFAERFRLPPEATLAVFLHGARKGLFELGWDVLCPLCRVPSDFKDSLKAIQDHAHCPTCNLDYDLDFSRSIELVLRAAPSIRPSERKRYCVGGPFLFPHVAAQLRLRPGERFVLTLGLEAGQHRLRSPQLPNMMELRVSPSGQRHRLDLELGAHCPRASDSAHLAAGEQHLVLTNTLDREMIVRVERMAQRSDALTAARASAMAVFRQLFPDQVLGPGQLVSLTSAAFVRTEVEGASAIFSKLGDPKAFELVMRHVRAVNDLASRHGGAVVKTVGAGVLVAFESADEAAKAALELHTGSTLPIRVAVHRGAVMAATLNDKLDYFGQTMASLDQQLALTPTGSTSLSQAVCDDAAIRDAIRSSGRATATIPLPGHESAAWALSVHCAS